MVSANSTEKQQSFIHNKKRQTDRSKCDSIASAANGRKVRSAVIAKLKMQRYRPRSEKTGRVAAWQTIGQGPVWAVRWPDRRRRKNGQLSDLV